MKLIKLNNLAKETLSKKETNQVKGGRSCGCSCNFQETGGASTDSTAHSNLDGTGVPMEEKKTILLLNHI